MTLTVCTTYVSKLFGHTPVLIVNKITNFRFTRVLRAYIFMTALGVVGIDAGNAVKPVTLNTPPPPLTHGRGHHPCPVSDGLYDSNRPKTPNRK